VYKPENNYRLCPQTSIKKLTKGSARQPNQRFRVYDYDNSTNTWEWTLAHLFT